MLLALLLSFVPFVQSPDRIVETFPDGKPRFECEARRASDGSLVRHGKSKRWHANGKLAAEGSFAEGKETGAWTFHFESGKRQSTGSFENGERNGLWKFWRDGGAVELEGKYEAGLRNGEWKRFDEAHKLLETVECRPLRVEDPARHWTWSGSLENGRISGEWEGRRSDGSLVLRGRFEDALPEGVWLHFFADGSFDEGWLSAEFKAGFFHSKVTLDPRVESGAQTATWSAPALGGDGDWLDRALAGDEAARTKLLNDAGAAAGAAVHRLATLDLSKPGDAALAGRIHEEILGALFGKGADWPTEPAAQRRILLRWHSVVELLTNENGEYLRGFDSELAWGRSPELPPLLDAPPFPANFPEVLAVPCIREAARPVRDSGKLEKPERAADETAKPNDAHRTATIEWLLQRQDASGAWRPESAGGDPAATTFVTAECALALTGEGSSVVRGPHMAALRRAGQWFGAHQSADGRIGTEARDSLYQHAAATCALVEMSSGARWSPPTVAASRAMDFLMRQRLADGSWPRSIGESTGDIATSARALHAIRVCLEPGRSVAIGTLGGPEWQEAEAWLAAQANRVATAPAQQAAFLAPTDAPTLLAAIAFQRLRARESRTSKSLKSLLDALAPQRANPVSLTPEALLHHTRVALRLEREVWSAWTGALAPLLDSGTLSSLDRLPPASRAGGRLLTAAYRAQILQVESRFSRKLP
ncbi:MAG: hypothetical protein HUU28_02250 [Planctomycetaceae bacterium]|nr:hypothetical protein [Planctomycetaceae bacterium]